MSNLFMEQINELKREIKPERGEKNNVTAEDVDVVILGQKQKSINKGENYKKNDLEKLESVGTT